jgi:hypothetical protein
MAFDILHSFGLDSTKAYVRLGIKLYPYDLLGAGIIIPSSLLHFLASCVDSILRIPAFDLAALPLILHADRCGSRAILSASEQEGQAHRE